MTISVRLNEYLNQNEVSYDLISHPHSFSSMSSAVAANIPPAQIAKAVILEDHEGRKMMAVLLADHKISLGSLGEKLNRDLHLIDERSVYKMFEDCEKGAIPPFGNAYNMEAVYDDLLVQSKELYLEAGDHNSLLRVSREDFVRLIKDSKHMRFSHQTVH
ncbi:aminoacyl-tRNA deacylase [Shewanella nanhaiensis]|uniref:YbaK/EbsC family protein n=1 Tax=Shewanella nanhaiensis TaxID=2864872 RepID=A0ABS7E4V5_9GAMM|nr:YbaK/EbsC family protein [Shewanella nanhaiensis]MBW8184378.1 YbaK/EbsC family protein [Shewanella nanhaiensis]